MEVNGNGAIMKSNEHYLSVKNAIEELKQKYTNDMSLVNNDLKFISIEGNPEFFVFE